MHGGLWSAEAIRCHAAAKTTADFPACQHTLTPAQEQALNRDMVAAMKTVANVVNEP